MIVQITCAKVGHRQAPFKQNGPRKAGRSVCGPYLVEANLRSKLRPAGPAGAKVTNRQAPLCVGLYRQAAPAAS